MVVEPRTVEVAELVTRMWDEERMVVKLIDEPGMPQAIRISFWALHADEDIDRVADAFARQLAARVA